MKRGLAQKDLEIGDFIRVDSDISLHRKSQRVFVEHEHWGFLLKFDVIAQLCLTMVQ